MSENTETSKIKYFEKFMSNVSHLKVRAGADPEVVKAFVDAVKRYTNG